MARIVRREAVALALAGAAGRGGRDAVACLHWGLGEAAVALAGGRGGAVALSLAVGWAGAGEAVVTFAVAVAVALGAGAGETGRGEGGGGGGLEERRRGAVVAEADAVSEEGLAGRQRGIRSPWKLSPLPYPHFLRSQQMGTAGKRINSYIKRAHVRRGPTPRAHMRLEPIPPHRLARVHPARPRRPRRQALFARLGRRLAFLSLHDAPHVRPVHLHRRAHAVPLGLADRPPLVRRRDRSSPFVVGEEAGLAALGRAAVGAGAGGAVGAVVGRAVAVVGAAGAGVEVVEGEGAFGWHGARAGWIGVVGEVRWVFLRGWVRGRVEVGVQR